MTQAIDHPAFSEEVKAVRRLLLDNKIPFNQTRQRGDDGFIKRIKFGSTGEPMSLASVDKKYLQGKKFPDNVLLDVQCTAIHGAIIQAIMETVGATGFGVFPTGTTHMIVYFTKEVPE